VILFVKVEASHRDNRYEQGTDYKIPHDLTLAHSLKFLPTRTQSRRIGSGAKPNKAAVNCRPMRFVGFWGALIFLIFRCPIRIRWTLL
jgi:hypothetical protein